MKRLFWAALFLINTTSFAQTRPLLENDSVYSSQAWKAATPILQASLECRQVLNSSHPALRSLLPMNDSGQWVLIPPKSLAVYGFPVKEITIYIDPSGEMGASYTSSLVSPKEPVAKAAKLAASEYRKTGIGSLMAQQGNRPSLTNLTCTVPGTRQPD